MGDSVLDAFNNVSLDFHCNSSASDWDNRIDLGAYENHNITNCAGSLGIATGEDVYMFFNEGTEQEHCGLTRTNQPADNLQLYHGYNGLYATDEALIGVWSVTGGTTTYSTSGNRTLDGFCPAYPDPVEWSNATLNSLNSGANIGNMTVRFSNDNSTWLGEMPFADLQMVSNTSACIQLIPNVTTEGASITPRISEATINYENTVFKPELNYLTINSSNSATNTTDTDVLCSFNPISYYDTSLYANITWWINGINNQSTLSIGLTNNTQITTNLSNTITHRLDSIKCEVQIWDSTYSSSPSNSSIFTVKNSIPTVPNILTPVNYTNTTSQNYTLFCQNSTDLDMDKIVYSIFGDSSNPPTTLLQNTTTQSYNWNFASVGTHWWFCKSDDGIESSSNTLTRSIYSDWRDEWNNVTANIPHKYEGESAYFEFNITVNPLKISSISSTLILNNTVNTATTTQINTTDYKVYTTLYSPISIQNYTEEFNYNFNLTYTYVNASTKSNNLYSGSFNVSQMDFHYCNPTDGKPYLNITFKDEITGNYINATIGSMSLNYSLNPNFLGNEVFTFTNSTNAFSYPFCFSPQNKTVYISTTIAYLNTIDGYPQKLYQNTLTLTNSSNNLTLQLLQTGYGQYVTFQVVNLAEQQLSDVTVEVRLSGTTIGTQTTDSAGGTTFFLNPNNQYNIIFNKTGYDVYATNLYPTQTSYTITLTRTSSASSDSTNYIKGISYSIEPNNDTLKNNTLYSFEFEIDSGTYDLDYAGFRLWNKTNSLLDSASCSGSTGCTASTLFNTGNNTRIRMEYYWIIEGVSYNQSRTWLVTGNEYEGESNFDWFKKDMTTLGDKAFGSGEHASFTKALIAFILTLIIVGTISFTSGLYSPFAISLEVFLLTTFWDLVGFIPSLGLPPNGTPHFITVLIGIITIGIFIYEYINR